jgi:deoxyribose-phosphate aldolase
MYTEFAAYNIEFTEEEIKTDIESVLQLQPNCISVPYAFTKLAKNIVKNTNTKISNPIDYPLGLSDIKTRNMAVRNCIDNGADRVQIVIQNNQLNLKKYDKIRQDIKSNYDICIEHGVDISYYLEYRIFTHQSLIKACNILLECGINQVYVSTGYMLDSVEDNIVATMLLSQKTPINTVFTSNIWNKDHIKLLQKNKISSIRFNNINAIKLYYNNI